MCDTPELLLISWETSKYKQMEDRQPLGNSDLDLNPAPSFQTTPQLQLQGLGLGCCIKSKSCRMTLIYSAPPNMNFHRDFTRSFST